MPRRPFLFAIAVALAIVSGAKSAGAEGARPIRVALVVGPLGLETPVTSQEISGLMRAAADVDVEARVIVQPIRTSVTSTYRGLAREGYDLLVAADALQEDGVLTAAPSHPDTRFAVPDISDVQEPVPANVAFVSWREEEIGFVVGYLAGLVERARPGPDVVGSVGGLPVPPVERIIAGYRAGAKHASPQLRHLNAYSGNFVAPESCKRVATAQIAKGAGVVFAVAGGCGLGALAEARQHGVFGIGVDVDESELGPHILTSAVKRWDVTMYRIVEWLAQGRLRTRGTVRLGLREHALKLGRTSPLVRPAFVRRAREIARQIGAGRINGIPTTLGG